MTNTSSSSYSTPAAEPMTAIPNPTGFVIEPNKLLIFAGVTGDFDDSRFSERNAYEKWKKT
jgi:hypothetical protein